MLKNIVTWKSRLGVTQGDWKWHHSIDCIQIPIGNGVPMALSCIVSDILNVTLKYGLRVIQGLPPYLQLATSEIWC